MPSAMRTFRNEDHEISGRRCIRGSAPGVLREGCPRAMATERWEVLVPDTNKCSSPSRDSMVARGSAIAGSSQIGVWVQKRRRVRSLDWRLLVGLVFDLQLVGGSRRCSPNRSRSKRSTRGSPTPTLPPRDLSRSRLLRSPGGPLEGQETLPRHLPYFLRGPVLLAGIVLASPLWVRMGGQVLARVRRLRWLLRTSPISVAAAAPADPFAFCWPVPLE